MAAHTLHTAYACGHTDTRSVDGYRDERTEARTSEFACTACQKAPDAPMWMRAGYASPEGYEGLGRMTREGYHAEPAAVADTPARAEAPQCPRCSGPLSACGGFCVEEG
jgi:hypothetical protein